jgi:hypothetical protein
MKTKFNEFLLEYIKNEKLANYVLNNIMNKLKKYYSNYKFIEIDDDIKFMFDFKKILKEQFEKSQKDYIKFFILKK